MTQRVNYKTTTPSEHRCGVLYETDAVVREEAAEVIVRIVEKVDREHYERQLKLQVEYDYDATNEENQAKQIKALEESLEQARSALHGIKTAMSLGRGGVVGWDGETSLSFFGVLHGAVIDHGDKWSAHT